MPSPSWFITTILFFFLQSFSSLIARLFCFTQVAPWKQIGDEIRKIERILNNNVSHHKVRNLQRRSTQAGAPSTVPDPSLHQQSIADHPVSIPGHRWGRGGDHEVDDCPSGSQPTYHPQPLRRQTVELRAPPFWSTAPVASIHETDGAGSPGNAGQANVMPALPALPPEMNCQDTGYIMYHLWNLDALAGSVKPNFRRMLREDIDDLKSTRLLVAQKLRVVQRMYRCYGRLIDS